jgi:hypothetical protein
VSLIEINRESTRKSIWEITTVSSSDSRWVVVRTLASKH